MRRTRRQKKAFESSSLRGRWGKAPLKKLSRGGSHRLLQMWRREEAFPWEKVPSRGKGGQRGCGKEKSLPFWGGARRGRDCRGASAKKTSKREGERRAPPRKAVENKKVVRPSLKTSKREKVLEKQQAALSERPPRGVQEIRPIKNGRQTGKERPFWPQGAVGEKREYLGGFFKTVKKKDRQEMP